MKNILGSVVMLGVIVAMGCGAPTKPGDQKTEGSPSANAASARETITIKGSDTMVQLVAAWAENFMKTNNQVEISVTGGGTGTGISALIGKSTDLCSASRDMTTKEKEQAMQQGVKPVETVVARDAIAVIVNPANPINELTLEQLKKIYTGALANWSDVGGTPGDFLVVSRESSSGTYLFFQEHVLKKEDYTVKARLMPATSAIIQAVSSDVNAIGYVGLGYAAEAKGTIKVLTIKTEANMPGIAPSEATVRDNTYSIARPLYFYTNDTAAKGAKTFIDFCLSDAGQKIVRELGYVPVK